MEKVFTVVSDLKDKIGPLRKKLNMSKSREEKESLAQQIETAESKREKAKKVTLAEIVKAYKLFCVYFVGKVDAERNHVYCELCLASHSSTTLEQKFLEKGSLTKTCQEYVTQLTLLLLC